MIARVGGRLGGREIGGTQRIFRTVKILCLILFNTMMIHIIRHLFKPTGCAIPRMNLNVNYRLGWWWCVDAGSLIVTNASFWLGMLITGLVMHMLGQGVHGKSQYLPLKFCCEPRNVLNKARYFFKCGKNILREWEMEETVRAEIINGHYVFSDCVIG